MHEAEQEPKWKRFEKLAYEIQKELAADSEVILNDSIEGVDSKVPRQIDISIRRKVGQFSLLVVIDCKDYKDPLDVKGLEEFAGLVHDVRANKGAIISSNGFTPAAINSAKARGIDTFRLVDSSSVDWASYVTLPTLLERTFVEGFILQSVGYGFMKLPYSPDELANLPLFSQDGKRLGTPLDILHSKWDEGEIPHELGQFEVPVANKVAVDYGGVRSIVDLSATVMVKQKYYLGQLPVKVKGLQDLQGGGIVTRKITTDFIEPHKIERGEVPGWTEVEDPEKLSVRVSFRLGYSDCYTKDQDSFLESTEASQPGDVGNS